MGFLELISRVAVEATIWYLFAEKGEFSSLLANCKSLNCKSFNSRLAKEQGGSIKNEDTF